jgi:hypothetical protein
MRSPGLMVISTVLNWLAFVAALIFQLLWPWSLFAGYNPSLFVMTFFLLLVTALLQTVFLIRNMRVTFSAADSDQSGEKAKGGKPARAADFVNSLDDAERAQVLDWMLDQTEEERRSAR